MENESKILETVAQHTVEINNIKEDVAELKDTQKMIYEMNSNISRLVDKLGDTNDEIVELKSDMKKDIGNLRTDMEEVKTQADKKDAKKWNESVKYIVLFILGAGLTIIAQKIGLM
jgi:archaellum component FlaC